MKGMRKWILGAAVVVAGLGMAAPAAKAAEIGIYAGGPVAYVPPSPGPGYEWVAGYRARGYWAPGRWNYRGYRDRGVIVRGYEGRGRDFDRRGYREHSRR